MAPHEEGEYSEEEVGQVQQALSGTYEIKPYLTNKCLDVDAGSTANGTNIHQWDCNGANHQKFTITNLGGTLHSVRALHSGKAMDADGGGGSGTNVHQWDYLGGANQKWYIEGSGPFVFKPSHNTGQCLDLDTGSSANGTNIHTWACSAGNNNQKFNLVSGGGAPPPPPSASWHEDFRDNFDGSYLDTNKWYVVTGTEADFNGEAQWYVNEQGNENNYWVSNGELKIKVQQETRTFGGKTKYYTSARLTTKTKFSPRMGAWEARMLFWSGNGADGVWPAWWLLGKNVNEAPAPGSACWPTWGARELDIMEYTTNEGALDQSKMITNFIQGGSCQAGQGNRYDVSVNVRQWHTYRLEFHGGEVKIFVDGQWKRSANDDPWQDQDYFAILNVAMGGGLGGAVSWPAGAYAGITVDYVKHESWY